MTKLRKRVGACLKGQSGFTLIEVLVAVAILGVVAVAFLSAVSTGYIALLLADENTVAESLTRTELENIRKAVFNPNAVDRPPVEKLPGYWVEARVGTVVEDDATVQAWTVIVGRAANPEEAELLTTTTYKSSYTKTLLGFGD